MARTEKARDNELLHEAIEAVMGILREKLPDGLSAEDKALFGANASKLRLDAARALVPLLERSAKMHGYDSERGQGEETGSIAAVVKRLEAVK